MYTENGSPILEEEYIFWSTRMEIYLKSLGCDLWNTVITDYSPPNRVRAPAQKKSKKINANAMEAILDGLPQSIKRNIGECVLAKGLYDKLEKLYFDEDREKENLSIFKYKSEGISEDEQNLFIKIVSQASKDN